MLFLFNIEYLFWITDCFKDDNNKKESIFKLKN